MSQDEIRRNILWVKDGVDTKALPLMIELMKTVGTGIMMMMGYSAYLMLKCM